MKKFVKSLNIVENCNISNVYNPIVMINHFYFLSQSNNKTVLTFIFYKSRIHIKIIERQK